MDLSIGFSSTYLCFMFLCPRFHGPFLTRAILRCVGGARCQFLPQTDTFIFPSLRFSLPGIGFEGCLPRNRFWQERTEDSYGVGKLRERENWSGSLCASGSANHPGLHRIAAMTDLFVYIVVLGYFIIFYFL